MMSAAAVAAFTCKHGGLRFAQKKESDWRGCIKQRAKPPQTGSKITINVINLY
jgi:hypothetical protein